MTLITLKLVCFRQYLRGGGVNQLKKSLTKVTENETIYLRMIRCRPVPSHYLTVQRTYPTKDIDHPQAGLRLCGKTVLADLN